MNRARAFALALPLAVGGALPACSLNQEGVPPPLNTFFYPTSAVTDGAGKWLFVANSNADLRYNDGTLVTVDLTKAEQDRQGAWDRCPTGDYVKTPRSTATDPGTPYCCWDPLDVNALNCDERPYIKTTDTIRIGSFAAGMVLQDAKGTGAASPNCASQSHRLYLAVRGNTSLTWVTVVDPDPNDSTISPALTCWDLDAISPSRTCSGSHVIIEANSGLAVYSNDATRVQIPLPNEPYALAVDDYSGLLYVGHLTGDNSQAFSGGFSLFDVAGDTAPRFVAPFPSPFPASSSGLFGVTALTKVLSANATPTNPLPPQIYASSRYVPLVTSLGATASCAADGQSFRDIAAYPTGTTYNTTLNGAETRGIEFVDGRAFVLQRIPPALVGFNGATADTVLETCSSPTFLYQYHSAAGDRLFVNCFDTGELYVFDPVVPHLVASFQIGRGPAGLVFALSPLTKAPVAYVVGFGDNNISVIDLGSTSPTAYHTIQRLGFPSSVPR